MLKLICSLLIIILLLVLNASLSFAIENPLERDNNKIGVHILFPEEIEEAATLVNANGDWGYVVIPIQSTDKDLKKWQTFMNNAASLHLIPIIRIATEGDYFNTKAWRTPTDIDIVDFANFLNSLIWPTKNRYVIIFNEVNRSDEWGDAPDPKTYAKLLNYAVTVFKSKNPDFFVLNAGLDNAAANVYQISMNEYDFLRQMEVAVPGIFNQIDGFTSHSYPNPGFAQPPTVQTSQSIASFQYEKSLLKTLTKKDLPIFISETGWSRNVVSENLLPSYYSQAFATVWNDPSIVTVAPFLLIANSGPFTVFSFFTQNTPSKEYQYIYTMEKVKGKPTQILSVLGESVIPPSDNLPVKNFASNQDILQSTITIPDPLKIFFKFILKIPN